MEASAAFRHHYSPRGLSKLSFRPFQVAKYVVLIHIATDVRQPIFCLRFPSISADTWNSVLWNILHPGGLPKLFSFPPFSNLPRMCFGASLPNCVLPSSVFTAIDSLVAWFCLPPRYLSPAKIGTISLLRDLLLILRSIRLNCVGIEDILQLDTSRPLLQAQYHDLIYLGRLIVSLACNNPDGMSNFAKSMEHISNHYSSSVKDLIITLSNKHNNMVPCIAWWLSSSLTSSILPLTKFAIWLAGISLNSAIGSIRTILDTLTSLPYLKGTMICWKQNLPKNLKTVDCFGSL